MSHPLARDIPSTEHLVQEHALYMSRLAEIDRDQSLAFSSQLNMQALVEIATDVLGSECCGIAKIYEGKRMISLRLSYLPLTEYGLRRL